MSRSYAVARPARLILLTMLVAVGCDANIYSPPPLPPVECQETTWGGPDPERIECREAVTAALAALPAIHGRLTSIRFVWGRYRPPGRYGPVPIDKYGTVFFAFEADPDSWYIEIEKFAGMVRPLSELRAEATTK